MKNELRCALIFLGPFPIGNVSSLRIMSYCKALANKGIYIKVLLIAPTAEAAVNKQRSGMIDGVAYQYITDITWSKPNTPNYIKLFYYITGLFKSIKYLRRNQINCLLSYHNELASNVFYRIVTKIMGIPFVIDKTEYPAGYFKMPVYKQKLERFKLRLFDGFITITNELKSFYQQITNCSLSACFLLPMTIDVDRYKGLTKMAQSRDYVAVVFGTHNRDGLYDSIKAYHHYTTLKKDNLLDLMIIGDFNELCKKFPQNLEITDYIKNNHLSEKVHFKGLVPINDVPQILLNATCLLTTPLSYISGGFPTKLGEYLLSGTPVVATVAGEIQNFLTNQQNALLSTPGDIEDVGKNINFIDENPVNASQIGKCGKELARIVFNAETYAEDLIKFLKNINYQNK